ncbi:hypothetical protein C8J55DRAFT_490999 [Lentinula edodes]|uniref:CBS domain-containing protein n=1 Tax=Lentinula lateritia TaxID=40482 RepID=A0A9W9DIW7_9AGAR|nr:hypothetical protein C8J55DRAFT_490999 [Lentinula edodes]
MPPDCPYSVVHTESMVGFFTCLIVKNTEKAVVKDIAINTVIRGMGGRYGNKGGILSRFLINDSSLCFVNCQLAAGQHAIRACNADAAGMVEQQLIFPPVAGHLAFLGGGVVQWFLTTKLSLIDQRRDAMTVATLQITSRLSLSTKMSYSVTHCQKRTISTTQTQQRRRGNKASAQKGTVAALKPSPALTVPENITVAEASQLCAAKRTDCVLVVDDEEGLSGIFTAKDLAYRVTAEGLDPHLTPVHQIMTRHPMVTQDTTSATEALQLMVSRHFRHLPVCNEDGNVVGLLDITKVFHEALGKVERSSAASEQLFNAMAGVQSELGNVGSNPQAAAMLAWADKLRERTALPDLTTPATVGPKTTVREVAKLMKQRRTTAVCVMEGAATSPGMQTSSKVVGIFTSKDVVLRVIAAGLDSGRCSVVRVMTPHPDTAPPTLSVHEALKKMHNGHYLNLPVLEDDGRLVAIVDVLKLTYATLEQMNAVSAEQGIGHETDGGLMWGRFFDSIGHDDTKSIISTPDLLVQKPLTDYMNTTKTSSVRSGVHSGLHDSRFHLYKKRKLTSSRHVKHSQQPSIDEADQFHVSLDSKCDFWWYSAENRSLVLDRLLYFDHPYCLKCFSNPAFGPSVNATRYERWIRAQTLKLNPPPEILKHYQNTLGNILN